MQNLLKLDLLQGQKGSNLSPNITLYAKESDSKNCFKDILDSHIMEYQNAPDINGVHNETPKFQENSGAEKTGEKQFADQAYNSQHLKDENDVQIRENKEKHEKQTENDHKKRQGRKIEGPGAGVQNMLNVKEMLHPDHKNFNTSVKKSQDIKVHKDKNSAPKDISSNLIRHMMNMSALTKGLNESAVHMRDIKGLIKEMKDDLLLHNKKNDKELANSLLKKLKTLIKKIDDNKSPEAGGRDMKGLMLLKDEALRFAGVASKYNKRSEKNAGGTKPGESFTTDPKNQLNEKIMPAYAGIKNDIKENNNSKNGTPNFNLQFFKNLQGSEKNASASGPVNKNILFEEQLQSIIQNARISVRDGKNGTFSIRLHPDSLGQVNVNLGLEHGRLTGKFLVDNMEAKDALLAQITTIKEQLLDAGIPIGEFHVNVRDENGRNFRKDEEEKFNLRGVSFGKSNNKSIQYDIQAASLHDGAIDVII